MVAAVRLASFADVARAAPPAASVPATTPPNIVYILTDDLGYGDIQALNPQRGKIKTPHMDKFATSQQSASPWRVRL